MFTSCLQFLIKALLGGLQQDIGLRQLVFHRLAMGDGGFMENLQILELGVQSGNFRVCCGNPVLVGLIHGDILTLR